MSLFQSSWRSGEAAATPEPATRSRSGGRDVALDGLRGLAAFAVVVHHALLTIPAGWDFVYNAVGSWSGTPLIAPLGVFWAGHEAVLLFFVLSGFVLVARYGGINGGGYVPYLPQRVLRLFVPYAVVVALSCALLTLWHPPRVPGTSEWFGRTWSEPVTRRVLADLVWMKLQPAHDIDTSIWSLGVEMRLSLVLPVFAILGARLPLWRGVVAAVLLTGVARYAFSLGGWDSNTLHSLSYAPAFLAGAIMAAHRNRIAAAAARLSRPALTLALAAAVFLYTWRWQFAAWWNPELVRVLTGRLWPSPPSRVAGLLSDLMPVAGAVIFIALAIGSAPVRHALERPWAAWLGRVSFSLYLVHPVVLMVMVHALGPILPIPLVAALAVPAAVPVGVAVYRYIERPSHQLARTTGRWVSTLVARRHAVV